MKQFFVPAMIGLCALPLVSEPAFAQGTAFTYQGRLNDRGAPASGSYDLRFSVYDNSAGGSQQGPILTNSATAISNGLFTVTLDFGNVFPGAARWLDIGVRSNGVGSFFPLTPRQALTPAPYAITAGNVISGGLAAGTYGSAVSFINSANSFNGAFSGNGAGLTNLNAASLGGLSAVNFWQLAGNNVGLDQFLGSANNQPVEIRANNLKVMQFAYASNAVSGYSPNVIGGSIANTAAAGVVGATIIGGGLSQLVGSNTVTADFGTVLGGSGNIASGRYSLAGGNQSTASGDTSIAMGSSRAGGPNATALGDSTATAQYSTALGGSTANGFASAAMDLSVADGQISVAMGNSRASGDYSAAMGRSTASGTNSAAFGASSATNSFAAALGNSTAGGQYATAMGAATATGNYSFAAGRAANANYPGAFVWADSSGNYFTSTAPNQFLVQAGGGVGIGLNNPAAALHVASAGDYTTPQAQLTQNNTGDSCRLRLNVSGHPFWEFQATSDPTAPQLQFWLSTAAGSRMTVDANGNLTTAGTVNGTSDRNAKEKFTAVSSRAVLDRVASLPISEWNFKNEPQTRHLGPMAQDFHAAFNVGMDDKHIATVDEEGVALAAIQGLNQKVEEQQAELEHKASEISELNRKNRFLEKRLDALEKIVLNQKSN